MFFKKTEKVVSVFSEKRLTTVVGAWVYYFLLSVIPMSFLLITAFSVFKINIAEELVSFLPEEFKDAGEAIASTAKNASNSATILFVITVIFSCTSLLNQMSKDGDFIYGVSGKKRGVFRRLWAVIALGVLFISFLGAAFLFAFGIKIFSGVQVSHGKNLFSTIMFFTLIMLLGYAVIILLNKFICPVKLRFNKCCLGALLSLFIIVLGTIGFTLYLRFFANYNLFYGGLAGVVVFLLWTYILMLGLVMGVIVNMQILKNTR